VPGKQQLIHGPRLDRIRIGTEDIDPDLTANCRDPHGPFGLRRIRALVKTLAFNDEHSSNFRYAGMTASRRFKESR